jgi:hypothetical protein
MIILQLLQSNIAHYSVPATQWLSWEMYHEIYTCRKSSWMQVKGIYICATIAIHDS